MKATVTGWFARWSDDRLTTVVAERDDTVAGFARFGDEPATTGMDVGYLAALYVDPDTAGAGIGRQLLEYALADFRRQGRPAVTLWVFRDNARARGLYTSAGFVLTGAELTDPRWRTPQVQLCVRLTPAG